MLGVIGPNGAGKTTLFNVVSGVASHRGPLRIGGTDVTAQPVHRRAAAGLGRTFQTSSLFPTLGVLENVRLAAQAHGGRRIRLPPRGARMRRAPGAGRARGGRHGAPRRRRGIRARAR